MRPSRAFTSLAPASGAASDRVCTTVRFPWSASACTHHGVQRLRLHTLRRSRGSGLGGQRRWAAEIASVGMHYGHSKPEATETGSGQKHLSMHTAKAEPHAAGGVATKTAHIQSRGGQGQCAAKGASTYAHQGGLAGLRLHTLAGARAQEER